MSPRPLAVLLLALLACSGGGGEDALAPDPACRELRWGGPTETAGTSLVLVLNDTMRRDRTGIYGGVASTPAFDAFAAENLWFANAFTQSPWTKPAVATLFTGLFPSQHGVASDPHVRSPGAERGEAAILEADVLAPSFVTLAERLRAAGYRTAAFVSNPWMERRFGFAQGFDVYDDSFARWDTPGETVTRAGLAWLEGVEPGQPFFLYLHTMDSHHPYPELVLEELLESRELAEDPDLPDRARRMIASLVRIEGGRSAVQAGVPVSRTILDMAYDKGMERFDRVLAELLAALEASPAAAHAAWIVTSDHGEALFAHGYGSHGRGLYDDEVAIPLAARLPGVEADTLPISCLVGLIDLVPTLCTYLGLACEEPGFGVSLLDAGSEPAPRYLVTEGVGKHPKHRALRNRRYKLVWEPDGRPDGRRPESPYSLYDIVADPGEERDLLAEEPRSRQATRAFAALAPLLPGAVPGFDAPAKSTAPLDEDARQRLRELGYLEDGER
ncbi:MAG: sulfatase [Proteobacteria bacterium]|nr:sulfatase [Pseudomonadota bacterium]